MKAGIVLCGFAAVVLAAGCNSKPPDPVEKGRMVYITNCAVCHNPDPKLPGSQGPAVAGSSKVLLESRLLHLTYPPGYTPQRKTHAMRAFPQLKNQIGDLYAFLAVAKQQPDPTESTPKDSLSQH
ncbi:MAG: cytochrome c [Deltaproteobacteria bacterium]|jgi:mono/diheme cytochrome c family protein|nr:cytochrome c [Deltaproteobacteria bacterium]